MAKVKCIRKVEKKQPVYNIQVAKNRNYFVDNILVKNSEKPLSAYNICNLLSINMEMFSTDEKEYKKQLEYIVPFIVRLSDNVISYELHNNLSPVKEQKDILTKTREIGMGITNLHGWLLKNDIPYDSDDAINVSENFMKQYSYNVFKASMALGEEKGSAPAFNEVKDVKHLMESIYFKNIVNEFFDGDFTKITHMRNMAHISIAPTGSLSNSFPIPCISSGIEPVIGPYYWRKTRAIKKGEWTYYFVIPEKVKEYVLKHITDKEDYKIFNSFNGSIEDEDGKTGKQLISIMEKYVSKDFFKPAHEIDYNKKIDLMAGVYKWVDAAISCTFNLPKTATKEDIKNIYKTAYYKGVRAVSVYVDGSREGVLIFEDPQTNKQNQQKSNTLCAERPETILYHCAPKRPKELPCNIHHTTVKGEKWLVLVGLFDGKPYELFAGEQEDLFLPKYIENGELIKNGGGKYNLRIKTRKTDVEYQNIADILMSPDQRSLTRMISAGLRHGIPVEFLTEQLRKTKADITEFASAVSRVLSKYETETLIKNEKCPNCGESMVRAEGCVKCISETCGYSRCG